MRSLFLVMIGVVAAACAVVDSKPEPRYVPASRPLVLVDRNGVVFSTLTSSRCDHEMACGFVGPGKRFGDRDACLNHYNQLGYKSLENCSKPIDREQLRECLSSIKAASCVAPVDDIGEIDACNYGTLCR